MAMEDATESCGSWAAADSSQAQPRQQQQQRHKLEVYNEVLRRLREDGRPEVQSPSFEDGLWSHFNRLPARYALDVNVERAEDVLTHKKLLELAQEPANRPVFAVRLVQVSTVLDRNQADSSDPNVPAQSSSTYFRQSIHPPPAFGSSPNLESLALEANKQEVQDGDSVANSPPFSSADEWSQISYVTFRYSQGAETTLLLSVGATVVDHSVIIVPAPEYQMLVIASAPPVTKDDNATGDAGFVIHKAEDVVSSKLSKVFTLGKDALKKAKDFDEKHQLTSTASAKVASFDKKIGLSEKISTGTSAVSEKFKEVDQKFQVSGRTKSALAATEQKVSIAGSAIMKNRYVLTGASWVTGAFNKVAKAASEVGLKTKEKVVTEQEHKKGFEEDFDEIYLSDQTPKAALSKHSSKPPPA